MMQARPSTLNKLQLAKKVHMSNVNSIGPDLTAKKIPSHIVAINLHTSLLGLMYWMIWNYTVEMK